jgi:ferric-dicitrate binding protein FerR (iron transport regulator)
MEEHKRMDEQFNILVEKYTSNTCSKEELEQFLAMVKDNADDQTLEVALRGFWEKVKKESKPGPIDWQATMKPVLEELNAETPVVYMKNWKRMVAAASVLFLLGLGYWFFNHRQSSEEVVVKDIEAPQANRAVITLADGKKVYLDDRTTGTIASEGNTNIVKTEDGKIIYNLNDVAVASGQYNTLTNPRGSKVVDLTLSDGSRVWLNAGSSVIYPVVFTGNERKVTMNGEAYFEVAHNAGMPFKVAKGAMEVIVLGTSFNVNAYDDESAIKVTLLQGSVKTTAGRLPEIVLKPGEQAQISNDIKVLKEVDLEREVAWKSGMFRFKDTNIEEIMRQVARWYDVEIEYKGNPAGLTLGGSVSRQANVTELLKRLEATGLLSFKIEGRKVMVIIK